MTYCKKLEVSAAITRGERTLATAKNYPVDPCNGNCEINNSCVKTIHAEVAALMKCARHGIATEGAEIWVSHKPCAECTKAIKFAGITKVYYRHDYPHKYDNNFSEGLELVKA
ncbi:deaminase [Geomicrobium sediminis]|uniref:dCMP deaminase n=1 Tax=Geomicrobium sediminis TaxID=1347788 RepID=A0ABS2PFI3_9BACL|nr:dCMP deaminase [Geomicrobium sediminis]